MAREMKDSGIAWIGEIPSDWEIVRYKNACKIQSGCPFDSSKFSITQGFPLIRIRDITSGNIETYYNGEYSNEYVVKKGDLLIGMDGDFNIRIWNNKDALLNQRCCRLYELSVASRKYIYYSLPTTLKMINDLAFATTVKHLSVDDVYNSVLLAPSLFEQQSIANFLDKKCSEIDELISIQEKMIDELKAYKQSVITETVTKGLDTNVEMKDSGIDWIGEIPKHWNTQRLRTLGWTQNGISKGGEYFGEDYNYPFVSYPDAYRNYAVPYPNGRANSSDEDRKTYSLFEGDVLFTRTSETIEEIGFASTCMEDIPNAVYSGFLIRFRPTSDKLYKGYSKYYFRSNIHRAYFVKQMNIVTRASLSQDLLKSLIVILPPLKEQKDIADYLETKCSEIDTLISIKQKKIDSLKDYKKSLIYEYVTGKKQVV